MEVSARLHAPAVLPQRISPRYVLDRRPDGPRNQSGLRGEEKILAPTWLQLRLLGRSAHS
jgi:hypothetical protein